VQSYGVYKVSCVVNSRIKDRDKENAFRRTRRMTDRQTADRLKDRQTNRQADVQVDDDCMQMQAEEKVNDQAEWHFGLIV
jgi:hypothetical protein